MENAEEEESAKMRTIKHDIRNQLSSITLALEQLRYEIENPTADAIICFDIISSSCVQINTIIKDIKGY